MIIFSIYLHLYLYIIFISVVQLQKNPSKVRKVAIIGCGPAGLGLAVNLKLQDAGIEQIDMFESRSSPLQPSQGGGVQLSGGVVVLERIELLSLFQEIAIPIEKVQTRDNLENHILNMSFDVDSVSKLSQNQLIIDATSNPKPAIYGIMRDAYQKFLYDATQSNISNNNCVVSYYSNMKCVDINESSSSDKVQVSFANDSDVSREYDMIFGADGVRSNVNQYVTKNQASLINKFISSSQSRYSGIRITFIVSPAIMKQKNHHNYYHHNHNIDDNSNYNHNIRLKEEENTFTQRFGKNSYVLTSTYGGFDQQRYHMVALVYRDAGNRSPGRKNWLIDHNNGYSNKIKGNDKNGDVMIKDHIRNRLVEGGFIADELYDILDNADEERIIDVGLSDRYLPLTHWSSKSNRVVLLGDAAHPMTPFLGQGANQALQDAYFLAHAIKSYNHEIEQHHINSISSSSSSSSSSSPSLAQIMIDYQRTRKMFVTRLSITAGILGYIETLGGLPGEWFRNNLFRFLHVTGLAKYFFIDIATPRID